MMNSDTTSVNSQGRLIAMLLAGCYALFTLTPNSHSLMVTWSWVFLVQMTLLFPLIWLLWQVGSQKRFLSLGGYLDWLAIVIILALLISSIFAQFHNQAIWYSWMALGYLAALYALHHYLTTIKHKEKLLILQGYLNLAFITISLILWVSLTVLPELAIINYAKTLGVQLGFNFSILELRNWVPLGHQNYVAGYLILAIPLLVGLFLWEKNSRRWLWLGGVVLGLVDLYTTQSRGGWLAMGVIALLGVGVVAIYRRRQAYLLLIASTVILVLFGLASPRLLNSLQSIIQGNGGGELDYRLINWQVGSQMGMSQPFTGVGLGNVPLLYQKFLPIWGGRESELAYQLHSTPAQLWAEMGIWGIVILLGAIAWLIIYFVKLMLGKLSLNPDQSILTYCLCLALLGYGVVSFWDFQLDNTPITGTLVIYVAYLNSQVSTPRSFSQSQGFVLGGMGLIVAMLLWLLPIHRAWLLSSQGFTALNEDKIPEFVDNLTWAHKIAPWQPYYPYQLGWNLGNIALTSGNPPLLPDARNWLTKGIEVSPYWEFGYSNLAWLWLVENPQQAAVNFQAAIRLLPSKRGLFYGLGLSWLNQGETDKAIQAMTLEALRDPLFITSPIWRSPQLQLLYNQVTDAMLENYTAFLKANPEASYWGQCRGSLFWWLGDFKNAQKDFNRYGNSLSKTILELSQNNTLNNFSPSDNLHESLAIQAWLQPQQRTELLTQAWILATRTPIPEVKLQELLASLSNSSNFYEWLTQKAPTLEYRRQRLGFNLVSRQLDGVDPIDFLTVVENLPLSQWFTSLFPTFVTSPELESTLQPLREKLIS
jgi:tetratricopeptide (TPR) repeat protein